MRGKRIVQWILVILIACVFLFGENTIKNVFLQEKTTITVYAPGDMESAFKKALSSSELSNCKIVMTDKPENADISVEYGKENDEKYTCFAFSPFVVAYNTSDSRFKDFKKSEIVTPSEYNDKFYEINLLKVIDEVIADGDWEALGVKELDKIRLFYPAETTNYWHDFYSFMLVTVNNGTYPSTELEMKKAVEYVERFINSSYTEAVENFEERIMRTDGFSENCIYIIPEKTVKQISNDKSEKVRLIFPLQTTNFCYYAIGKTENAQKVVECLNTSDSVSAKLVYLCYRNFNTFELGDQYNSVYDERDVYNVIDVPKENFFTTEFSDDKEEVKTETVVEPEMETESKIESENNVEPETNSNDEGGNEVESEE